MRKGTRYGLLAGLALLLAACGGQSGSTGGGGGSNPSFTLSLNPTSRTLQQGGSGQVSVSLTRQNFSGGVTLSLEGNAPLATSPAPDKIAWSFNPNPATGNGATLTLQLGQNVPPGSYSLTVRGQAQGLQDRTAPLSLTVQPAPTQGSGPSLTWTTVFPAYDVAYGNGVFVAVRDAVLVSPDGQNWEAVRLPQPPKCRELDRLSFVNGRFLALDMCGITIWESSDGRTWTVHAFNVQPSSPKPSELTRIVFKDGTYYTMGRVSGYVTNQGPTRAGWLYSSQDLTNWTKVGETGPLDNLSSQFIPSDLAFGGGYFVVVGEDLNVDAGVALVSANGQTWTRVATGGMELMRVLFGNNRFVAIGFRGGGGGIALASPPNDPTGSWTSLTPPDVPSYRRLGLAFDGTRFLTASEGKIWAYDGTTANPNYASLPRYINDGHGIAFNGSQYVFMGDGFASSPDLRNWTTGFDTNYPGAVTYGNGKFVLSVVDYPSAIFATAAEGPFPAWRVSDPTPRADIDRLAFLNGQFVGVGQSGRVYLSNDGNSWNQVSTPSTQSLEGVAYGGGTYVAVGLSGAIVYSGPNNPTSWNLASGTNGEDFFGVAYGNGRFVAVGEAVYTSSDGATWTKQTGPGFINDVAFGNGQFVAVSGDKIYRSTDGVTWQTLTPPPSPVIPNGRVALGRIVWTGSFFIAVGGVSEIFDGHAYIITSTDGQSWTLQDTFFLNESPLDIAVGNQYALAIFRYGALVGRLP
ncbi:cell wall-binding protein [Thermus islandicus]|uniref:cell wall-binding protein n=1 Tax=Thermus islandicus TaxID=540988 RepID=UPI0003B6EFA8|nr:cell wall-binding protein [Thermus islandicus]